MGPNRVVFFGGDLDALNFVSLGGSKNTQTSGEHGEIMNCFTSRVMVSKPQSDVSFIST